MHSSASAMARWSSQTIVSQRRSPVTETLSWPPCLSRTTSEQVASKEMPTMSPAATPAFSRAARTATHTADQISRESCSA
ncbi:hypothetical protein AJ88_32260 [Mesorhizobium amorphae CCBAU 01583]|nr:hypothetical protein AJ88_32260 [Mesorhizobium amorphae CCBAU 01583]